MQVRQQDSSVLHHSSQRNGSFTKHSQSIEFIRSIDKLLQKVLGIKYPTIISNVSLYKKSKEIKISTTIRQARWKLFGHILRRDRTIPANLAMNYYFSETREKGFRGRRIMTLPLTLVQDLHTLHTTTLLLQDHSYYKRLKMNDQKDLEILRLIAQDREEWRMLTRNIVEADLYSHHLSTGSRQLHRRRLLNLQSHLHLSTGTFLFPLFDLISPLQLKSRHLKRHHQKTKMKIIIQ